MIVAYLTAFCNTFKKTTDKIDGRRATWDGKNDDSSAFWNLHGCIAQATTPDELPSLHIREPSTG